MKCMQIGVKEFYLIMKTIRLIVKFNPKWILENQNAGKSKVVEDVVETIKKHYEIDGVFVVKKSFTNVVWLLPTKVRL